jgi:predicted enzyme related to lactoylglutathione lyase
MLNSRVRDLDAMLSHLRAAGVEIVREEQEEGAGRFAWIVDPEDNRVELWEPQPDVFE